MDDRNEENNERERDTFYRGQRNDQHNRINVVVLFDRLGYDLQNPEEVKRLNRNLEFVERQRIRSEKYENSRMAWAVSVLLVVLGGATTAMFDFLTNKIGRSP